MSYVMDNFDMFSRIIKGISAEFGENCEVVLHDLTKSYEHTIVAIENGMSQDAKSEILVRIWGWRFSVAHLRAWINIIMSTAHSITRLSNQPLFTLKMKKAMSLEASASILI